jgi:hypothetical protein
LKTTRKQKFRLLTFVFVVSPDDSSISFVPQVGFIFVFNLVVGTGSLLLPKAFSETGWVLSTGLVLFLAFTSYLTVTFVIEALSCSNAILKWRRLQFLKRERVS